MSGLLGGLTGGLTGGLVGGLTGSVLNTVTATVGSVTSFLPLGPKEAETHYEKVYKENHGKHKKHQSKHYSHEELSAAVGYAVSKGCEREIAAKGGHPAPHIVKELIEELTGDELAKLVGSQGLALPDLEAITRDVQRQAGTLLESTLKIGLNIGV